MPIGHFEIGKNLHIEHYYYAKKYFQDTDNSGEVAENLSKKISAINGDLRDTTIISYGSYAGLFINKTVSILKRQHTGFRDLNYAIIDKDKNGFSFTFDPVLHHNLLIVLPITCTFDRYFRLRQFLEEKYTGKNILTDFFSIILVLHKEMSDALTARGSHGSVAVEQLQQGDMKELYTAYKWESMDLEKVIFSPNVVREYHKVPFMGYFLENYPSKIFLAENCPICFPSQIKTADIAGTHILERPLVRTLLNNETLNTIFKMPRFGNEEQPDEKPLKQFHDVFYPLPADPIHLHGHLKLDDVSYLDFIQQDIFYKKNKEDILDYFFGELWQLRDAGPDDHIIILNPGEFRTSGFLDDLIAMGTFGSAKVTIIPYPPFSEFLENFIYHYDKVISSARSIIFFDDVIAGGKHFKLISDYLKSARLNHYGPGPEAATGFNYVLTIIDRSTKYAKEEIKRKMATPDEPERRNNFIAFFKLNVPQIDTMHVGNPIKQRETIHKQLLAASHLDALKLFSAAEIAGGSAKDLEQLKADYKEQETPKYFPFIKSQDSYLFYDSVYTFQRRNMIKLHLFHEISGWLMDKDNFNETSRRKLFDFLKKGDRLNAAFDISKEKMAEDGRDEDTEKEIIEELVIKILAWPPFRSYRDIYEVIFNYNNDKLLELSEELYKLQKTLAKPGKGNSSFGKIHFNKFRQLKIHIKRSIDLDSNFIISEYFLLKVKELFINESYVLRLYEWQKTELDKEKTPFAESRKANLEYQRKQIVRFKYFLLHCYKELIYRSPARSMVLEKLLNKTSLQPFVLSTPESIALLTLKEIITNSYYQLRRILQSENTYFLQELMKSQMENNQFVESLIRGQLDFGFEEEWDIDRLAVVLTDLIASSNTGDITIAKELHDFIRQASQDPSLLKEIKQRQRKENGRQANLQDFRELIIKRYYYYKYFNSTLSNAGVAAQARGFLLNTDPDREKLLSERIVSSVLSTLYTVSLLKASRYMRNQPSGSQKNHFINEIKRILKSAATIIGDDLDCGFFIEYRERQHEKDPDTSNIFTIVSTDEEDDKNTILDRNGMIYNMLYGLEDHPDGNLQTFLAIAKTEEGEILSLKDEY